MLRMNLLLITIKQTFNDSLLLRLADEEIHAPIIKRKSG